MPDLFDRRIEPRRDEHEPSCTAPAEERRLHFPAHDVRGVAKPGAGKFVPHSLTTRCKM
jgi:hypothetical protein